MNSLVHTEMREVLYIKLYIKVGSQDNQLCRINSQYLIDYILYDKSPSSITKIFQYSSC